MGRHITTMRIWRSKVSEVRTSRSRGSVQPLGKLGSACDHRSKESWRYRVWVAKFAARSWPPRNRSQIVNPTCFLEKNFLRGHISLYGVERGGTGRDVGKRLR